MREIQDIFDLFPYCLIVALPVFILLSPINPCEATHDFQVHRLAHYELGGALYGSKLAAISMEARSKSASKVLRKLVVAKAEEMSISTYNDLASNGAGGVLILVAPTQDGLSKDKLETVYNFEDHAINGEMEIPVYYAEESPELLALLEDLEQSSSGNGDQKTSGAQALLDGIISNGFQLVASAGTPKALQDQNLVSIQANLNGISKSGFGEEDGLPTIVVAAHYDTSGAAPGLSFGADSNGSGVAILMELARIWGQMYRSAKSRPNYNLVFLLTGGGKINFLGTKKWLDEQKDDQNSELFPNMKMAVCLDSLGNEDHINMYVSKPPKEGTLPFHFLTSLQTLAKKHYKDVKINLVHKKINLANDFLAWEHERFSIHKLSAFTLSHFNNANDPARNSIFDTKVDEKVIERNAILIGEALACTVFDVKGENCQGTVFTGSAAPSSSSLKMWITELTSKPRATSLLVSPKNPNQVPIIKALTDNLKAIADEVRHHFVKREKRDPEYTFYDSQIATMNSYRVKPAVFDLVLTLSIAAYLGLVYLILMKWSSAYLFFASFSVTTPVKKKGEINGNSKMKSH